MWKQTPFIKQNPNSSDHNENFFFKSKPYWFLSREMLKLRFNNKHYSSEAVMKINLKLQ